MGVYGLLSPRIPIFSPYKYHGLEELRPRLHRLVWDVLQAARRGIDHVDHVDDVGWVGCFLVSFVVNIA